MGNEGQDPVVHQHDAPTVPLTTPTGATQWMPPTAGGASSVVLPAPSVPRRKKSGKLVGAGVGAVAVLIAGAFAVRAVTADEGGYESPTAAAEAFFASIASEDVIGAMDAVLPGEQAAFRQPLIDVIGEMRRLEIASDTADMSAVAGIDIEFADLEFVEQPTNVDDITNVEVNGSASIAVDGAAIPLGDLILDAVGDSDAMNETFEGEDPIEDYVFTTVRDGGGWYVSLGYTVAERARWETGEDEIPSPDAAVQPAGGATPEEGMDVMLDAVEDLDLEGMIAALDPNEFAPLQRYAPLFLDDAQKMVDDAGAEMSIEDREYTVDQDGSKAHLTLSAATVSLAGDGMEVELEYGDGCIRISGSQMETQNFCADDIAQGSEGQTFDDLGLPTEELTALGETVSEAFADMQGSGITMTEVDGQWYVSPLGTMSDTVLSVMQALDRSEIEDIGDAVSAAVNAFFSDFSGSLDDPFGTDPFGEDTGTEDSDGFSAYYECLDASDDVDVRAQCLQDGIDAGTIDPLFVSPQELYPQCGLAEYYEAGFPDFADLSDDEFIALYTEAQTCFQGLVSSGEISEDDGVPMELRDISCYEGRNPDAIEDVDERFDVQGEVFDCLMNAG